MVLVRERGEVTSIDVEGGAGSVGGKRREEGVGGWVVAIVLALLAEEVRMCSAFGRRVVGVGRGK